jgi:hypothetical protein
MSQDTKTGVPAVKDTVKQRATKLKPEVSDLTMALSLQRKEWQELRSTSGIILRFANLKDPIKTKGHSILCVMIGLADGDVLGNNATGEIFINGMSVDELLPLATMAEKEQP